jgi:23S rRNA (adenine2030-N6)-methyltransferase
LNYRHAFHAGNFADLVKHAAILALMDRLSQSTEPLLVVDTHAGAGIYDLGGEMARKSGEADAGILRLMNDHDAPEAFAPLKAAVRKANADGGVRFYPGSPSLTQALAGSRGQAKGVEADGYDLLARHARDPRRLLALIDPPFEKPDDYARILGAARAMRRRSKPATTLIWLPLKDLETFDGFLRGLEELDPGDALVLETRLNRLSDPMKMNGCALVILKAPPELGSPLKAAAEWTVASAGGAGGVAKLWRLNAG